jgi:hypothetical protein
MNGPTPHTTNKSNMRGNQMSFFGNETDAMFLELPNPKTYNLGDPIKNKEAHAYDWLLENDYLHPTSMELIVGQIDATFGADAWQRKQAAFDLKPWAFDYLLLDSGGAKRHDFDPLEHLGQKHRSMLRAARLVLIAHLNDWKTRGAKLAKWRGHDAFELFQGRWDNAQFELFRVAFCSE